MSDGELGGAAVVFGDGDRGGCVDGADRLGVVVQGMECGEVVAEGVVGRAVARATDAGDGEQDEDRKWGESEVVHEKLLRGRGRNLSSTATV